MTIGSSPDPEVSCTQIESAGSMPLANTRKYGESQASLQLSRPDEIDSKLSRRFKSAALTALLVVLLAGLANAVGWAYGIDSLKHPTEEPGLQGAIAVDLILLSIALMLLAIGSTRRWRSITGRALSAVVVLGSSAAFIEHTCHTDLGHFIKLTMWPAEESHGLGLTYPGPILPHESFSLLLLGLGTLLFNVVWKNKFLPAQILAVLVFVPSFIILSCYMLGASHLCIYFGCVSLSPITSLVFLLYSMALFLANPDVGVARILSLRSAAGMLARRTCAGVGILSIALLPRQWLISAGEAAGLVDASTVNIGTAIVAGLSLCGFGWWCFLRLETEETEKHQAIGQKEQAMEMMKRESESHEPKNKKMVCLECMAEYQDHAMTTCPADQSALVAVADNFRPGSTFAQVYQIVKELGAGGMSTVYLAEHLLMNKKVAVKVLHTRLASDPKTVQRFQREAQATSSLSHPNLVAIYDFNVTADGEAYLVMEFLEGQSLSEFIARGEPMPWGEALKLFMEVCDGVEHAHSKGIVHRDLKPANIMLLPSPDLAAGYTPKVVDFGLAKVLDDEALHLTHTGEIFGSPLYMSPEQCQGLPVDVRSDIYSLGCILYAILSGAPPFQGPSVLQTLMLHINASLPPLKEELGVPQWLEKVIEKAVAKEADQRFQSVLEMMQVIKEVKVQKLQG